MRPKIATGEFYHVYNRGIDKRNIFNDQEDIARFLTSMREFNVVEPIGSLYHKNQNRRRPTSPISDRLVNILSYDLNPNHIHFIMEPLIDNGVSELMKRLGGGYTKYFNEKNKRSGALFQGKYKYKHIPDERYLLYLSAYVNLNDRVHKLDKNWKQISSFNQYVGRKTDGPMYSVENKEMIIAHFKDEVAYEEYALEALEQIRKNKEDYKNFILE